MQESDIPGASLGGRDPGQLKVPELKQWLLCRSASTKGKKADLVGRLVTWLICRGMMLGTAVIDCVYLIPVQSSRLYQK